jgi:hypothetical protein
MLWFSALRESAIERNHVVVVVLLSAVSLQYWLPTECTNRDSVNASREVCRVFVQAIRCREALVVHVQIPVIDRIVVLVRQLRFS